MKKSFLISLAISVFGIGMLTLSASAESVATTNALIQPRTTLTSIANGELIKGTSYDTVYYLAEDGKRYVFPNSKTYFSWYDDFSKVREIPDEELFGYPLGGNVRYRPGSLLVKITTNPKVYAVGEDGKLRWVKNEAAAKALYGDHWNKLVDDIADSFFTNYEVGDDINGEEDFNPTEIEEEYPSISHNRGFKAKKVIKNRIQDKVERRCGILEEAVNKLQKRAQMYGIEIEGVGDDFAKECVEGGMRHLNKIKVCQRSAEGETRTLEVAPAALRGMLAHRATLGECVSTDVKEEATEEDINKDATEEDNTNSEEELKCEDGQEVTTVDGVDSCTAVAGDDANSEEELKCEDGQEVTTVDGVDSCTAVEEEGDVPVEEEVIE